jgi:hypothetical protein
MRWEQAAFVSAQSAAKKLSIAAAFRVRKNAALNAARNFSEKALSIISYFKKSRQRKSNKAGQRKGGKKFRF